MVLIGLVRGKHYGTEGVEPCGGEDSCDNGSCKSGSGGSFCLGYRGHCDCGNDVVVYCQDPNFFNLPPTIRLGMIRSKDRVGETMDLL
jgi:hypothetical protein